MLLCVALDVFFFQREGIDILSSLMSGWATKRVHPLDRADKFSPYLCKNDSLSRACYSSEATSPRDHEHVMRRFFFVFWNIYSGAERSIKPVMI
jgi:hypothetical protein